MLPFSDPILIFAGVMILILIAPLFARRVRLPEIVGLIAAGTIVGPYGLRILTRDPTVQLLGTVGLLYIMFLAGLEIDLHQVRSSAS
jgi:Kef-type K+ transport system membrane component KefB